MGTIEETAYVEKLHQDIKNSCEMLEEIGYDSLVIIAADHKHAEMGSARGRKFLEDSRDVINRFLKYRDGAFITLRRCVMNKEDNSGIFGFRLDSDMKIVIFYIKAVNCRTNVLEYKKESPDTVLISHLGPKVMVEPITDQTLDATTALRESSCSSYDEMTPYETIASETKNDTKPLTIKTENHTSSGVTEEDMDDADSELSAIDEDSEEDTIDSDTDQKRKVVIIKGKKKTVFSSVKREKQSETDVITCIDQKDGRRRFQCGTCSKKYIRKEDLLCHQLLHSGEAPYGCSVCKRGFRSMKMLRNHASVHLNDSTCHKSDKNRVCEDCGKVFSRLSDLTVHKRKHSGDTPFTCEVCKKGFRSKAFLRNHMATHSNTKPFACDQCDKKYARKEDLIIHKRKHSGDAPYPCEICGKVFRSRGMLRAHRHGHSNKNFDCPICGNTYTSRANLYRHKLIHSKVAPYICDTCGKGFRDPSSFKMHRMVHLGERPHKCEVCGKGFLKSTLLIAHKRTHTGEKPFICEFCSQQFRTNANLTRHIQRKHGEYRNVEIITLRSIHNEEL